MNDIGRWEAPALPFDRREILRYAALPADREAEIAAPLAACLREVEGAVHCRGLWRVYPIDREDKALNLGFLRTESQSLQAFLAGAERVILFAMTAGFEMDRLIARGGLTSPLKELLLHAIGAERVESACDRFCAEIPALCPGWVYAGRFSPGYGDLPLETQRAVFAALPCESVIGVRLNPETLLMSPSKSVTAIAALRRAGKEEGDNS